MGSQDNQLSLIQVHFERMAERLRAEGAAARSFDHGTNRGQIREAFVRELLSHNTSPLTGVGTGEILHAGSCSGERRNQIDVVIHSNRFPRISLAAGIDLFFGETVSSFIEIKVGGVLWTIDVKSFFLPARLGGRFFLCAMVWVALPLTSMPGSRRSEPCSPRYGRTCRWFAISPFRQPTPAAFNWQPHSGSRRRITID